MVRMVCVRQANLWGDLLEIFIVVNDPVNTIFFPRDFAPVFSKQ